MASFDSSGIHSEQPRVDEHYIDTPEQVELRFSIAGIGSRFVAILLDTVLLYFALMLVFLAVVLFGSAVGAGVESEVDTLGLWFVAVLIVLVFAMIWGFFALFEALARNLLRVVDYLPGMYLTGVITMLCNKRNKRLGDMVAGTIVVHERADEQPMLIQTSTTILAPKSLDTTPWQASTSTVWGQSVPSLFPADAVAKLSQHDLMVIETFFARMLDLPLETRAAMAYRIAGQMTAKMGATTEESNPERILESIAYQMRGSGRAR